jgi:hypothetical protein
MFFLLGNFKHCVIEIINYIYYKYMYIFKYIYNLHIIFINKIWTQFNINKML